MRAAAEGAVFLDQRTGHPFLPLGPVAHLQALAWELQERTSPRGADWALPQDTANLEVHWHAVLQPDKGLLVCPSTACSPAHCYLLHNRKLGKAGSLSLAWGHCRALLIAAAWGQEVLLPVASPFG